MEASVQIACTPTPDTPGLTLVLTCSSRNYVFGNLAEGTQRALTENGHRLTKVHDIFITGSTRWKDVGGLLGMTLTLADSAKTSYESAMAVYNEKHKTKLTPPARPHLNLYGPPNLKHLLSTCRRFIFRKGIPLTATEYSSTQQPTRNAEGHIEASWEDANIKVWALPVMQRATAPGVADTVSDDADTVSDDVDTEFYESYDADALAEIRSRVDLDAREMRRYYDESLNQFDDHQAPPEESDAAREERYSAIRDVVIGHMFDSAWSLDTLVERHISEVEMPTAMYLRNPSTGKLEPYRGPKPGGAEPLPDIKVLTRTPWPGATVMELPPTEPQMEALSYIVRTHPTRGKFDPQRAKELGLRPGKNYALLTRGTSVTNEHGETITPDMVMGPDQPGQGFAILDVPTVAHLKSLIRKEEFAAADVMEGIRAFVWNADDKVVRHPTFQEFVKKFSHVKHIIANAWNPKELSMIAVAEQTIRLRQIDPYRYGVPYHNNSIELWSQYLDRCSPSEALFAKTGLRFRLKPTFGMHTEGVTTPLSIEEVEQSTPPDIIEAAKAARNNLQQDTDSLKAWRRLVARPDAEIITLGTGSALPSKYRNVSATLLRVPGVGNYLFDCGENTLGQLRRVFEPRELRDVLRKLRMVWISHLHADHHLGTVAVIKAWYEVVHNGSPRPDLPRASSIAHSESISESGLAVISHEGMLSWLAEYSRAEDFGYSRILPLQITPAEPTSTTSSPPTSTISQGRVSSLFLFSARNQGNRVQKRDYECLLGLSDIQAARVAHCFGAMAVSLTFSPTEEDLAAGRKPFKVSYSGDCRPSGAFAAIGHDSTVLIHEATFDDEMQKDAIKKKHSTTSEALGIGAKMNAKAVVLTHFSQRYQKIPVLQTVDNGQMDEDVLTPEAIATEEAPAEEEEEDATADNMDMASTNMSSMASALPRDGSPEKPHEKVIKVGTKDMKVAVAFDYMKVKVGDIAELSYFHDALNLLLSHEKDEVVETVETEEVTINKNGKKTSPSAEKPVKKKAKRAAGES
ncbi:hypothetical protein M011DRAFT_524728 [Sporormia fimetaria CBS 119925]|uniref:ribonuclease Z n=1 Tax=Sporormia fimetaria CBS 119925 TaxID=1340428 RepID=A0A6A6VJK2_9PLEO|nr:hypothetical protein M011DRAFT_524728 [Sporormia fimetaria CBS 119925]